MRTYTGTCISRPNCLIIPSKAKIWGERLNHRVYKRPKTPNIHIPPRLPLRRYRYIGLYSVVHEKQTT